MPMLWPVWAQADTPADTSRVDQVLVYPGGATVERVVAVKAGQKELHLHCLSTRFDAETLQIQAPPGVTLGAISVRTVDRVSVPECANTPLDQRIAELEGQIDTVAADIAARELGFDYLKDYRTNPAAPATSASLTSTMEALRKSASDYFFPPYQALIRRQKELKAQLAPLEAERDKVRAAQPKLRSLTVQMAATRNAEVRLSERTTRAGWVPVYRAYLDTVSGQLRLERHAQLSQASGEDWSDVKLRLLTTKPRDAIGMRSPDPWTLDLVRMSAAVMSMSPPNAVLTRAAPLHLGALSADALSVPDEPQERVAPVQMIESEFAAEFDVPARASVAADGQQIVLKLGEALLPSKVKARVQPAVEERAYLVAESDRPEGLWPVGQVQLFRDGTFVGQSDLRMAEQAQLDLFFGIDELVRVRAEPEQRHAGVTGLIGQRAETKVGRVYRIENLHQRRFNVQVLEAAPVSRHDDIKVQTQLQPKPALESWRNQPGVMAWELTMEPKAVQRLSADYVVSYPKEAGIIGLPGQ